jgi:hypothetical protein
MESSSNSPSCTETISNIVNYVRNNNGRIDSINKLKKDLNLKGRLSIYKLETICIANNLSCNIGKEKTNKKIHGCAAYEKGCRCGICKLSCNLTSHALRHFGRTSRPFIDNFALKNIKFYKLDDSFRKEKFFRMFRQSFQEFYDARF